MKIYKTTKYYGDKVWFTRYSSSKHQFAAVKGAVSWALSPWWWLGGQKDQPVRVTLEMIEFPDTAWVMIEDTHGDPSA